MAYNTRRSNNFVSPNNKNAAPRQVPMNAGKPPLQNSFISGGQELRWYLENAMQGLGSGAVIGTNVRIGRLALLLKIPAKYFELQLSQPINPPSAAQPQQAVRELLHNAKQPIVQPERPNLLQQSHNFLNQQQPQPPTSTPQKPVEQAENEPAIEGERKPKPHWVKKEGKINKRERRRRQNERLKKILQPKNALMVLNELVGNAPCEVNESTDSYDGTLFNCVILVDGVEHLGKGKSKPAAKTAAAEIALKHMVLSKLKNPPPDSLAPPPPLITNEVKTETPVSMETDEELQLGISWSHVASYALHKLLSSWDDGNSCVLDKSTASVDVAKSFEKKPAKKLPEKAAEMNPTMLLNQMFPSVSYEEVCKVGNPPSILYKMKCVVGDESFVGTGSTKKIARKMCAFAACKSVLGIEYSKQFLDENNFNDSSVTTDPLQMQQ